jgi:PAS domain S-box-containing protein
MNHQHSNLVDALPSLVWTAQPDGLVDFVNRRWCEYSGLDFDEACGRGWQEAVHPEDLPEFHKSWHAILASGQPGEMEGRLRRFDGEHRWFLFRASPLTDPSGHLVKWCGVNTDIDDQKKAAYALNARETNLRAIVDGIPGFVFTAANGRVEFANRQILDYSGKTLEELKDWAKTDLVHPDDRDKLIATAKNLWKTGQSQEIEHRLRRADGTYRWFDVRRVLQGDSRDGVTRWYLLLTDIDERKNAEEALQLSEHTLRRAETLLAGEKQLLELIATGRPLSGIIEALCRLVESTASGCYCSVVLLDSSGTKLQEAIAPSLPSSFNDAVRDWPLDRRGGPCTMAAHQKMQVIMSDVATDTRWRTGWRALAQTHGLRSCWSTPIVSLAGKVLGTFALYYREPGSPAPLQQDLIAQFTHIASIAIERAQSDAALKRSEAFLAQGQRVSVTGTFSWLVSTGEIAWSEQAYRIFEIEPKTTVTLELFHSRVHVDDIEAFRVMISGARDNCNHFEHEHRLQMPNHSIKYLRLVAHGSRNQDDQLEYIGTIQDITERYRSEEALGKVRAQLSHVTRVTSLGALTASIAHEVNQPLSGIITNAGTCLRMLAADPPNIDGARETAQRAKRDGERAADVISRLRGLFRKDGAVTASVNLNDATNEVIALTLGELQRGRVSLRSTLADSLPPVTGDRIQLQQVILNLMLNASDAMHNVEDRPRHLVISTEQDEFDDVRLTVRDVGAGFDPLSADRLFEAFYTTKSSGMGIGLSVSRDIIEHHGGRLWAVPNDGPGASFFFSLPQRLEDSTGLATPLPQ